MSKNIFTRGLSLLLIISMMTATFLSCSEETGNPSSDSANTTSDTTAALNSEQTQDEEDSSSLFKLPNEKHSVPDNLSFNNEKFNILYPEWQLYKEYLWAEEATGAYLTDEIYNRTLNVEEYLEIDIDFINAGYIDDIYTKLNASVMSGDGAYQMVITHCINGLIPILSNKLVLDWKDVPYVDFSKPYWNQSISDTLTIKGITPYAASDLLIGDPNVIFFNKDIAEAYQIEDLYQTVRDGKWTIDKMIELSDVVIADLNGDSKMDKDDQYGLMTNIGWPPISFMYGFDQYIIEKGTDDVPVLSMNNEKMATIVQKLYTLICEGNRTYTDGVSDLFIPFETHNALFYVLGLAYAADYRETEVEYGIIPFPKYDEAQTEYISLNWTGLQCIPKTETNLERAGAVAELLAYESREHSLPAYFDNLLGYKVARDPGSVEMLKIIFDNLVYDFGLNFSNQHDVMYTISKLMQQKSTDVTSYLKRLEKSYMKQIDKVYDSYLALKEE